MERIGYKNPTVYSMMEFEEILIGMDGMLDGTIRWLKLDVSSTSLQDLFKSTDTDTFLPRPTKEEWIWSMNDPKANIQPYCNANGINIAKGSSRARFGIISNQENNCHSCDSRIGVGGSGHPNNNIVVGNTRRWMPDGNNGDRSSFAYMFVRSNTNSDATTIGTLPWINAVRLDATGHNVLHDVGRAQFDEHFNECPVMRYRRNDKVEAIYVRKTRMPSDFSAYGMFTMTWKSTPSNVMNEDFELYSTEFDMLKGT